MLRKNYRKLEELSDIALKIITTMSSSRTLPYNLVKRSSIIVMTLEGLTPIEIRSKVGMNVRYVRIWLKRFVDNVNKINELCSSKDEKDVLDLIKSILSDKARSGRPRKFTDEQRLQIVKVACNKPKDYKFPIGKWSLTTLSLAVRNEGIVDSISPASIQRILRENKVQPHRSQYWLHSKEKDESPETYKQKITTINELYALAQELKENNPEGIGIFSSDEMTGIQALERIAPDKLQLPGSTRKIEFEYRRHGTTSYIGFMDCINGTISTPFIKSERKEADFVKALDKAIKEAKTKGKKKFFIILDNLNIHVSTSLVEYVAKVEGYKGDLGIKGKKGILRNKATRTEFLTNREHTICFAYTPKHCSWMNQIENFFGKMNRQLLKVESFKSVKKLKKSICDFINFHNRYFAKTFKWTYKTTPLGD